MADNSSDYRALFLNDVPMMDARAPVEFSKGAFPGVINLPLMNDIERQKVGTCYKQHGQDAAIQLGHQLVCGQVKDERVNAWVEFARANPDGYLYCFRGGLRSQTVQRWLKDAGVDYPRIIGGYKAMRTFLLDTLHEAVSECDIVVLGGMTGTGKTEVLTQLRNSLDLEGIANHRGSSFGKRATGQPAQIDFENRLIGWPSICSRSAQPVSNNSLWKMKAVWSAVATCRWSFIKQCKAARWSGWKTASRTASSAFWRIMWSTSAQSSSASKANRRALACSPSVCCRA
ncbi:tRNA 2-selenouridine synthase [Pseudomonas amygdali pv. lachrymans]|nr:tRNA 2-selenouridine synthase [Pseudomonas amygdali pv. lachrymans]